MEKSSMQNKYEPSSNGLKQSVCRWCYSEIPLEIFTDKILEIGISSIDLLSPNEWPILKKYNITCSMATDNFVSIERGFNNLDNHGYLKKRYTELIAKAADYGIGNVICFSGNRLGLDDETGIENCIIGLEDLIEIAEKYRITLMMELLNSKIDHPDYQCDNTNWGIDLAKRINSPSFKLLYDIYHMQVMEGDIIHTISKNYHYFGHYHTAGVPGRNEIGKGQELNYREIIEAIVKSGFNGHLAHEFIPTGENKLDSLIEAYSICKI